MIFIIAITLNISGQIPNKIKFQAIARDINGQPMINQQVSVKIKIRTGYMDGSIVYSESHDAISNSTGIINLNIGEGVGISGNLISIDWLGSNHFIDVTINGTSVGVSQIMAVPFAMHAEVTEEVDKIDYENVTNKPDIPSDISQLTDFSTKIFDADYNKLRNTPAFSGSYKDLVNTPEINTSFNNLTDNTSILAKIDFYSLLNRPTFSSNSYNDLTNKPDIKTKVNQLTDTDNKVFSGSYNDLKNKPFIFSGKYIDLKNKPVIPVQISEFTDNSKKLKSVKFADINPTVNLFDGNYNSLTDKPAIPIDIKNLTDNSNLIFDGSYNNLTEKPTFISNNYNDLSEKPIIPKDVNLLTDKNNMLTNLKYSNISNTPTLPTKLSELTKDISFIDTETDGSITNELQNINQVLNKGSNASGNRISNLKDPTGTNDIATKLYIDALEARYEALKKRVDKYYSGTGIEVLINKGKTIAEIKAIGLVINKSEGSSNNQEGDSFDWIGIGDQIWMSKNIGVQKFANNSNIPYGPTTTGTDISNNSPETFQFEYNNSNNEESLGRLYTWNVVSDSKNVCPTGWRVPTLTDWNQLVAFMNTEHGGTPIGNALKSKDMWATTNGLDVVKLRIIPAGIREATGGFNGADGEFTRIWLNTEDSGKGKYIELRKNISNVVNGTANKNDSYSVRCIKE